GNAFFKTNFCKAPMFAEKGLSGEEAKLRLELQIFADVGILGFPNAGKSTMINVLTNKKPKIADYPFTTIEPEVGVMYHKGERVIIAEIPGIIEGASKGKGLGLKFLKHAKRVRGLLFLLDATKDPAKQFEILKKEIKDYDKNLLKKKHIVVVNKIDLCNVKLNGKKALYVSLLTNKNIDKLKDAILKLSKSVVAIEEKVEKPIDEYVFEPDISVKNIDGVFYLYGKSILEAVEKTDFENRYSVERFNKLLKKMGVEKLLKKNGIKDGDLVRIGKFEFRYFESG
ncbi:MAG: Obg family GTPase CgtA, partial [bacterium]|nr:Obg family GTPase CgtA [bacterium]